GLEWRYEQRPAVLEVRYRHHADHAGDKDEPAVANTRLRQRYIRSRYGHGELLSQRSMAAESVAVESVPYADILSSSTSLTNGITPALSHPSPIPSPFSPPYPISSPLQSPNP